MKSSVVERGNPERGDQRGVIPAGPYAKPSGARSVSLKGRDNTAQGNALGISVEHARALKGRQTLPDRADWHWARLLIAPFQGLGAKGPIFPGRCPGLFYWPPFRRRPWTHSDIRFRQGHTWLCLMLFITFITALLVFAVTGCGK